MAGEKKKAETVEGLKAQVVGLEDDVEYLREKIVLLRAKFMAADICGIYLEGLLNGLDPKAEHYEVGRDIVRDWRALRGR